MSLENNALDDDEMIIQAALADDQLVEIIQAELSSSDEDARKLGGSLPGRALNKDRDFVGAFNNLQRDDFSGEQSTYDEDDFAQ